MWLFKKKHPKDKLNITNLFPRMKRRVVKLYFGIGEAIAAMLGLTTTITATAGGVTAAGTALTAFGAVVATAINTVLLVAASMALSTVANSLTSKSGKQSPLSTGGLLQNTSMVIDPIRIIYGKQRVGCSQVFVHTEGGVTNQNLHVICVWGEGPVNKIATDGLGDMIWINDERIQDFSSYLNKTYIYHEFHNGSMEQGYSTVLKTYFPAWADALRGTVYSYFRCVWTPNLWTSFPQFTALIEGRTLFDPRNGSIAYSRNPALVWRDFKTHPRYGGGILGSLIDKQSVIDAANWFDANSFYFDGTICQRQGFLENIEEILMSCRSEEIWSGGLYRLLVQKYDTPVMSLTEKDIMVGDGEGSNIGISTGSIQDFPKRIKITFADPVNNYVPAFCYWPETAPYEAETDKEWKEIILVGVADFEQALKIGKFFYNRTRYPNVFSFVAHPRVLSLEIGDMVAMSHDPAFPVGSIPEDWSNKVLRVIGISITQGNQVFLILGDEDSSIYDTTVNISSHTSYTTTLPAATDTPEEPTNLSAATGEDTTTVARDDAYIDFQWDNMGPGVGYQIRYKKEADASWQYQNLADPGGIVSIPVKTATGPLTMQTGGNFSGVAGLNYKVEIDGVGSPNTFKWSDDGGSTWDATGVPITSVFWQTLNNNVKVKFSANTGGIATDNWVFTATPMTPIVVRIGRLPVDVEFFWQVRSQVGLFNSNPSNFSTPSVPIVTWKATEGPSMADVNLAASSGGGTVYLEWSKDFEDPSIDKWLIYRNITDDSATALLIDEKSRQTLSYRDVMVLSSTSYYYWLKGKDRNGNISATFSMAASVTHVHSETNIRYIPLPTGTLPSAEGSTGYVVTASVSLQNCDDYTQFTTDSIVSGAVVVTQEKIDIQEGSGALRIKLTRYPKVRYFETPSLLLSQPVFGSSTATQYQGQSFKLTSGIDCKTISVQLQKKGSPGNITAYLYTDSGGKPGASLGSCTILAADINTTTSKWVEGIFSSPIALAASTKYWLVLYFLGDGSNYYYLRINYWGGFGDSDEKMGSGSNLTTGFTVTSKDMLFRICVQGDALNKYIYSTISSKDLSAKTYLKSAIKSLNRTGGFLSQSFGEAAIGEQNFPVTITAANAWEVKASDISAVAVGDRNAVIKIGIKITNMDADAEFLLDNFFANIDNPFPYIMRGTVAEKILTEIPFNHALIRTIEFPHSLNGAALIYTERATAGTTTLTVPSGKVWYLVHCKAVGGFGGIYINNDLWWATADDFLPANFYNRDIILDDNDHIDLTTTGTYLIAAWVLEVDEDPQISVLYQSVSNVSTYTVPAGYTLVVRRMKAFSSGTKIIADNTDFVNLGGTTEILNSVSIFDEGTVLKADAASVKFFGYLIPKSV